MKNSRSVLITHPAKYIDQFSRCESPKLAPHTLPRDVAVRAVQVAAVKLHDELFVVGKAESAAGNGGKLIITAPATISLALSKPAIAKNILRTDVAQLSRTEFCDSPSSGHFGLSTSCILTISPVLSGFVLCSHQKTGQNRHNGFCRLANPRPCRSLSISRITSLTKDHVCCVFDTSIGVSIRFSFSQTNAPNIRSNEGYFTRSSNPKSSSSNGVEYWDFPDFQSAINATLSFIAT